jgi:hypothetical protein
MNLENPRLVRRRGVVENWAVAATLLFAFTTDASAQTATFARDDYPSFAGGRAVVSADFNRDGRADVAIANAGRNTATILLNRAGAGLVRQTREDGVSMDQIVLSAEKHLTVRPGAAKRDATILPSTQPPR